MILSVDTILDRYAAILTGKWSYSQANLWAWDMMQLLEMEELCYQPPVDELLIWELITYLVGLDMPGAVDKARPLLNDIDIIQFLKQKGLTVSNLS